MRSSPRNPVLNRFRTASTAPERLHLKPLAQTIALLLLAGSAHAAPAFSPAWFAAKNAPTTAPTTQAGATPRPGMPPPLAQQQRVQQQLGRSLSNMNNTVAAIAASQAAQAAGRNAAMAAPQTIYNGLGGNGLNISVGADGKPLFVNAEAPQQSQADGKVNVSIKQTADKAILNWDTFNVGRDTTVNFQQDANWAALNRVNNSTSPSQIQGQIKAAGTVMIVNNNGVVFSGSSQVNVRNLVTAASTITDEQFGNGLYNANAPTFSNAQGNIRVETGAQLSTATPTSATVGGGYVLLLGKEVENAGTISTPKGQTLLAAGDSFSIRRGVSTEGNPQSTTRGNEITATGNGKVLNSGLLMAAEGDVTLTANQVQQRGAALASTSVNNRGTIHLNAAEANGSVTLGEGSVSAILLEENSSALNSQRDALLKPALNQENVAVQPADVLRRDQSLVQVQSTGTVDFEKGSTTLATGGQVDVSASGRTLVRDGAVIDVAGATGVKVAMASNNIKINLQGNEQRDSSANRDQASLNNSDVWVDTRELVLVPAGTNGYATDRWYTAGGLIEVGGYLGNQNNSVGQWMAQGGSVSFTGNELVTQAGSQINLSGGTLDVQAGTIQQTWLKAEDGRLYEVSSAPGDILYSGIYKGFEDRHERWGTSKFYYNPLIAPRERFEAGYSVGRDAGRLVVSTLSAVLEGTVASDTFQGERQTQAAKAGLDGYQQSHNAVARSGQLIVGNLTPYYVKSTSRLEYGLSANETTIKNIVLGGAENSLASQLDLTQALPEQRQGTLYLDSRQLNSYKLGTIKLAASEGIQVNEELRVAPGGEITLYSPQVAINANLSASGGVIQAGDVLNQITANGMSDDMLRLNTTSIPWLSVGKGVVLDASGLWTNLRQNAAERSVLPYINGGTVSLRSSNNLALANGSLIDVSSGAALQINGALQGGQGGNVNLHTNAGFALGNNGVLTLGGELRGQGVKGGGTLSVAANKLLISDKAGSADSTTLQVSGGFFNKGFSAYSLTGARGLEVAEGTRVEVTTPVYRLGAGASGIATGADPERALESWTPPLYMEDAINAKLTQRAGASLTLQVGNSRTVLSDVAQTRLVIGKGAIVTVDPGQALQLSGIDQITIDGQLNAWGGRIRVNTQIPGNIIKTLATDTFGSIWVGENARLDVAARAVTAVDSSGKRYGTVANGGSIVLGGEIDHATGDVAATSSFIVLREGSVLDTSGSRAQLDINGLGSTQVASQGGTISLASTSGLYLDGQMRAAAGGVGVAGGSLEVALGATGMASSDPLYPDIVRKPREMVLTQGYQPTLVAGSSPGQSRDILEYGQAQLAVEQVQSGGFDNLSVLSSGLLTFAGDLNLTLNNALQLYAGSYSLGQSAQTDTNVSLGGSYVRLAGSVAPVSPPFGTDTAIRSGSSPMQTAAGQLTIKAAGLLDIRDYVRFGVGGSITLLSGEKQAVARRGFADVQLYSLGDVRFLGANTTDNYVLSAPERLSITAAQLYPGTGTSTTIRARQLDISRSTSDLPPMPYAPFGRLTLDASIINQGGIVRAPLGSLTVGSVYGYPLDGVPPSTVNLLPGSLTSVSAAGLLMPYGGTVDGKTWQYEGENVQLEGNSTGKASGINIKGQVIDVADGAVVDISGGGELSGAGFVSGRGGSTDARVTPLMQYGADGLLLPGLKTNPVYAIVPGVQAGYAPVTKDAGAVAPLVGQQITLGAGVPGLQAGTYTLLPATYALLPGAFRVEVNGLSGQGQPVRSQLMPNGSWSASGVLGLASGTRNSLPNQVLITSADVLRRYSQYNESTFSQFQIADAARLGVPTALMARDGKALNMEFSVNATTQPSLSFNGSLLSNRGEGGRGSRVSASSEGRLEVVKTGQSATPGFTGVTLQDDVVNAVAGDSLGIGGTTSSLYGQGGNFIKFGNADGNDASTSEVFIRSGAQLRAPEVLLITSRPTGGITVEQGASISTLGQGPAARDSRDGYIFKPGLNSVVAVSNAYLRILPGDVPNSGVPNRAPGRISIGTCASSCSGVTSLYSEGIIATVTDNTFELSDAVRFGTRNLTLAVGAINVGSAETLAGYAANNLLPSGLVLNQTVLDRLLRGDTSVGAPALEVLELGARDSINYFGNASLDTFDPATGVSKLSELVLTTPAIYGKGEANETALIRTNSLIWNGAKNEAGAIVKGGAGSGSGNLQIDVQRFELGYVPDDLPSDSTIYDRLAVGFANVTVNARERVTANNQGALAVYQSQLGYKPGQGFDYSGGNLIFNTPLLTGNAGSISHIRAGGDIRVISAGAVRNKASVGGDSLGAELSLSGRNLLLDGNVLLPSGKLSLTAQNDLSLAGGAYIDLSGRKVSFNDVSKYSWAGDLIMLSREGNIRQAAGSQIDLSAEFNQGGTLQATALAEGAGSVVLLGSILGSSSGYYDAGGTLVPYKAAGVNIRGQNLGGADLSAEFASLNQRLNQGRVFGERSFQLKQGDLVIGDGLKAGVINLSLDAGLLSVLGTVDASGEQVGSIRLAGKRGLSIGSQAVLDAHGSLLRVDSYGKIIDAPNRAVIELSSGEGQLTLAGGARIDLRHGTAAKVGNDGKARGSLALNAPRLGGATRGDIGIDASGKLLIDGAGLIAVNAMQRYDDAPAGTEPAVSGQPYQVINQAYLDGKHAESDAFINNALANTNLLKGKLAGLTDSAYSNALHLRPGIEIVSKTADGDLVVQGDLDLSGYRYASLNPNTQKTAAYGSGEVANLVLRAGGNLDVFGSINDGFAPPPETPDDTGWVLLPGKQLLNGDVVVPRSGIVLEDGTSFLSGVVLNYDLPIKATTMLAGTRLPVDTALAQTLTLRAGTVLAADVRNADGSLAYAAGSLLRADVQLAAGMLLGAGSVLLADTAMAAVNWPKGVPLPGTPLVNTDVGPLAFVIQSGSLALPMGGLIPAGTDVKLAVGIEQINLRPGDGKGRNWAVAQMLPEGSQSWSMQMVAGADLQAADTRLLNPDAERGSIRLADTHYGYRVTAIPGKTDSGKVLTAEGSNIWYGDESQAGKPVSEVAAEMDVPEADVCAPGLCKEVGPTLTVEGSNIWYGDESQAGKPVSEVAAEMDVPEADVCAGAGLCSGPTDNKPPMEYEYAIGTSRFSVLRTGTGDLELLSTGDLAMQSLYGVYTAGTSTLGLADSGLFNQPRGLALDAKTDLISGSVLSDNGGAYGDFVDGGDKNLYRAWYPDQGGNLLLSVGGDLTGDILGLKVDAGANGYESSGVGNWLWRQGGGALQPDIPTAWWINFGTYTPFINSVTNNVALSGFTGFGTLGGGNLDIQVGGDAGLLAPKGNTRVTSAERSSGLVLAVGSTGRMVDGELQMTGGGDLNLRVGGAVNPAYSARNFSDATTLRHDLYGSLTNLRGAVRSSAASYGGMSQILGSTASFQDSREVRAYDPYQATKVQASGGWVVLPGDSTISLNARGGLVLGGAADPGRAKLHGWQQVSLSGDNQANGYSWFSLWTDNTAIDLFAAGGNLVPSTQMWEVEPSSSGARFGMDYTPRDGRYVYPSILRAAAPAGSFYLGASANFNNNPIVSRLYSLLLAPGEKAQLEFLAGESIYAGGYAVSPSNAPLSSLATPYKPGFYMLDRSGQTYLGETAQASATPEAASAQFPLFAFGGLGVSGAYRGADEPARFYAVNGDIVGLSSGEIISFTGLPRAGETWYQAARPVRMMAGRDIVGSGGVTSLAPGQLGESAGQVNGNLFVHNSPTDVSVVSAGRDIIYSTFNVAGPGTLEVTAGRNIQMEDRGSVTSIGAVVPGDNRPGAGVVLQAGASDVDYLNFALRYLNPANLASANESLASGKVAKTYEVELQTWLKERFAFTGNADEARQYFTALPGEQQRIFARDIYFNELLESGREYNNPASVRSASYIRGRNVIEALFPSKDSAGVPIAYAGDITMYGGSGIRTLAGGDIHMLTPGGQQLYGLEGVVPPGSAGVITQGQGNIKIFSHSSVLLGLSRIMTSFGGDIQAWSSIGDINAGRGSKTTQVFTPPRRVYDNWGNVSLSPTVPSTGAGIATLNPIAEVAPGDIDLIAPLGTIDAGEAGIRVSGNVNIAALQVVNAANIQVQGESTGIPVVASVNTGALASASSAATSASTAAEGVARDQKAASRKRMPSVFNVKVLGFGSEPPAPSTEGASRSMPGYDAQSSVRVLGAGQLDERALSQLTEEERGNLSL